MAATTTLTKSALRKLPCRGLYRKPSHAVHMKRDLPWLLDTRKPVDVVFVGDDLLERMLWFDHGKLRSALPRNIMVAAVSGDRIENALYRMESSAGILFHLHKRQQTRKIVLWLGQHNVVPQPALEDDDDQKSAPAPNLDRVVNQLRQIVQIVRQYLPSVEIEVWALPCDAQHHPDVATFNQKLAHMCTQLSVKFSDQVYQATRAPLLLESSDLWLADGQHLSAAAYRECVLPALVAAASV